MADRLARLGSEPRKLEVGKSFDKKNPSLYHGIRYDFKPVSIDEEKDGLLEVQENKSVAVSLPHVDGSGQTNYKGHLNTAAAKECVLIIDNETGQLTIERLTSQILMKKTRPEKGDGLGGPAAPQRVEPPAVEKSNPYAVHSHPTQPTPEKSSNPYAVKTIPDPYAVKKMPDPYGVKKVPDKPRNSGSSHQRQRKPSKDADSDFSITPLNSAKSSPAQGSAKPSPIRNVQVDMLGRQMSSSSDSSSDSDSDFDNSPKAAVPAVPGSMSSLLTQDFNSVQPQQKRGGVLPSARPEPPARAPAAVKPKSSMPNILGDDLMLSDSDNSD